MSKKTLMTALCAMALCPAFAQTSTTTEEKIEYSTDKYKVETNRFRSNWFVSVGAGGQVYFGDHDRQCKFGDRIAPALDIAVGKWFTPGIGVRLTYSGLQFKGATQTGIHDEGVEVPGKGGHGYWLHKQKFPFGNVHADVLFNLNNLIRGYSDTRVWSISPYVGVGYARVYEKPKTNEVTANLGLLNSFRLCRFLDLNLDIHSFIVNDGFDGEVGGYTGEGALSVSLGLTYKFAPRGWGRGKTLERTVYDNAAINEMRRQLEAASAENERLREALAKGDAKAGEASVKKIAAANLVVFEINRSNLSNEARVNLGILAEVMKQGDAGAIYTVTGYVDRGTGDAATNERLSRERAEAVYNCLTKEFGVPAKMLRIDYKGGVENMYYDDPRLSRAVITSGK